MREKAFSIELKKTYEIIDELAWSLEPLEVDGKVKKRLMESVGSRYRIRAFADRLAKFFNLSKKEIKRIIQLAEKSPGEGEWKPLGLEGVFTLDFSGGAELAEADCGLVYLEGGAVFPRHCHRGAEYALLVQGEIKEDNDKIWRAGDFLRKDAHSEHFFSVVGDGPVIIAIALYEGFYFTPGCRITLKLKGSFGCRFRCPPLLANASASAKV